MANWNESELTQANAVDELRIATARKDDTLRNPVIIWHVVVDGNLYIRAVYGTDSLWYRHAMDQGKGSISAGGIEKSVVLVPEHDSDLNDQISASYRSKYGRYAKNIVDSTQSPQAVEATLRVDPA